jgi:hypothetical protein
MSNKQQQHNCLEIVRANILESGVLKDYKDKYVKFEKELTSYGDNDVKHITTGQGFTAGYYFNTKTGLRRSKTFKSFVAHRYCPFCGKEYGKLIRS